MMIHVRVSGCDDEFATTIETDHEGWKALEALARKGNRCVPGVYVHAEGYPKPTDYCSEPACKGLSA